jgi:hypothetical protein
MPGQSDWSITNDNGTTPAQSPWVDSTKELGPACFAVLAIPNKGKGLVARVKIAIGSRILVESPLFSVAGSVGTIDRMILEKVRALSREQQRQYLSLHNRSPGQNPMSSIFATNALPCGSDSPVSAVYPTICFINHSCIPNAHNNWNSETNKETIHAVRDILAGEEITIPYTTGERSIERLAMLNTAFGFKCTCELCSNQAAPLQESDARRAEITRLDQAIGDPSRTMTAPHQGISDCRRMLQLLRTEYKSCAPTLEARLYYDAFQISIIHGDQARASAFAERAYTTRRIGEGDDSPEVVRMKSLMENPAQHVGFGASRRWRTAKSAVPEGLDEGLEDWLWKRGGT